MNTGQNPREVWRRYRCGIFCPGCPCCGSVKLSRELKETQRRAKAKQELYREVSEAFLLTFTDDSYFAEDVSLGVEAS